MKPQITIGHLPILDHLILGVAEQNDGAYLEHVELVAQLFPNWDSIATALAEKKIDGAFLFFPLTLDLFRNGADIKLILLGHREGQVLVARNDVNSVADLKGKTIFLPHRFSTHHILLFKALQNEGLDITKDVNLKIGYEHVQEVTELLARDEVQAFIIAEPFGTEAVRSKIGKILALSHGIKTHHIDCVLVMRNEVVKNYPKACEELTESLVRAGMFVNAYPRQAAEIGEQFLEYWSKSILLEALTHDKGHILFWDLLPRMEDFEELQNIAVEEMGLWPNKIDLRELVYPDFAQNAYREWMIDVRREVKDRGAERTLPGSFAEAATRVRDFFNRDISVIGVKMIQKGEKYPHNMKRVHKNISLPLIEGTLGGEECIIENLSGENKGIAFVSPVRGVEPYKVILKLEPRELKDCLQALGFGKPAEISEIEEGGQILEGKGIQMIKLNTSTLLVLDYAAFRFLALLLPYYRI